ncbi:MAG: hypothetical protein JOY60_13715 [Burkholderiaceae bacterium]|nr:hypothetical protein [Burkholderiaceae bacterium]
MKSTFAWVAGLVLAVFALAFAPVLWHMLADPAAVAPVEAPQTLPWQIDRLDDGATRVLGLTLGRSTLADVQRHWGDELMLAVLARDGEIGALEAFVDSTQLGFVSAKLVFTAQLDAAALKDLQQHAVKSQLQPSGVRRYTLAAVDRTRALQAVVTGLTVLPSVHVDAALLTQRFGAPGEQLQTRVPDPDGGAPQAQSNWLYPALGLAVAFDAQGHAVLQYVAPKDFGQLREPLLKSQAGS